jgi:diguanylate cyclase (GGDEF)-like protein
VALVVVAAAWALVFGLVSWATDAAVLYQLAIWPPLLVLGVGHLRGPSVEPSWKLLGLGVALFGLGDLAWDMVLASGGDPDTSVADVLYLSGYVAIALGVALLLRSHGGHDRRDGAIDGVLLAIPSAVLIVQFIVLPGDDASLGLLSRTVLALYPLADVLLVAAVVWLILTPGLPRRATVLVAGGLGLTLVADLAWATASMQGNSAAEGVVDAAFPLTYVVIAAGAAFGAHASTPGQDGDPGAAVLPWGRVVLLVSALIAAPMSAVVAVTFAGDVQPALVVLATLVAAALVAWRFGRMVLDLERTTAELRAARVELMEQAVLDPLTGAYNRLVLPERLAVLSNGAGPPAAVLSIDLDHFKQVNDLHGHHAGDVVLEVTAQRLRANTREHDVVVRMGGDEFLVILDDVDPARALELANRIVAAIEQPIRVADQLLSVSASIGIAMVGDAADEVGSDEVLHRADAAMYVAKRSGSGVVELAGI